MKDKLTKNTRLKQIWDER